MNTVKQRLLTNWHFARILRLVLGIWMLVWALQTGEWPIAVFSGLFIYMALSNTGCCGAGVCVIPGNEKPEKPAAEKINNEQNF